MRRSIAYASVCDYGDEMKLVVRHEAAGHGFGKLGDEYYYADDPAADDDARSVLTTFHEFGLFKNVDITSDPSKVIWGKFLADPRYEGQGLGVFEGAVHYKFGAYRPTDNSIMNDNLGEFNAPSREAIYYRMHKLVYGDSWVYNYEDFVKYDEINRNRTKASKAPMSLRKSLPHLAPPVVVLTDKK